VEHTDLRRLLLVGTVSALSLTALFALFALLVGRFDDTQVRILTTTGGFGLASLLAMPGTRLLEQDRDVALGQLVVFMATATFVLEFWAVWIATESNLSWRALVVAVSLTTAAAQIASSLARRRPSDPESVGLLGVAAAVFAVLLAILISYAALEKIHEGGYYRLLAAVAVVDVLFVTLQAAVRRFGAAPATVVAPGPSLTPSATGFVCVLADGRRVRPPISTRDLPSAVAAALRELERRGERVRTIELGEG